MSRLSSILLGTPLWAQIPSNKRVPLLLAGLVCAYTAVFTWATILRHQRVGSHLFDLGIHDQALWLISRGEEPFLTLRGLHLMADHFQPIAYLLAPLYLLPQPLLCLLGLQSLLLALGAVPVYGLARAKSLDRKVSLCFAALYLLNPSLQHTNHFDVHFTALQMPLLLYALWSLETKKAAPYAICLALVLSCGEAAGFTLIFLGWSAYRIRGILWGLATSLAGLMGLLLATKMLQDQESALPNQYLNLYAHYGRDGGEILWHLVSHPLEFLFSLLNTVDLWYAFTLLAPLLFLPLLAPSKVLPILPVLLGNLLSWRESQHSITFHYTAAILPFLVWAAIDAYSRVSTKTTRTSGMIALLTAGILGSVFGPLGVFGARYEKSRVELGQAVRSLLPAEVSVSADNDLGAQISQRKDIYLFPNPFHKIAWGRRGQSIVEQSSREIAPLSPAEFRRRLETTEVEWIALEKDSEIDFPLKPADRKFYLEQIARSGVFQLEHESRDLLLFRRRQKGRSVHFNEPSPSLSADGSTLAFVSNRRARREGSAFLSSQALHEAIDDIVLYRLEDKQARILTSKANGSSFSPRLSEDAKRLVFSSEASNLGPEDRNAVTDIILMDLDSETVRRIVPLSYAVGEGSSFKPQISADGEQVTFLSFAGNPDVRSLYLAQQKEEGSWDILLPTRSTSISSQKSEELEPGFSPSLSENGVSAIVSQSESGIYEILVRESGGQVHKISGNDDCFEPSLSADGTKLVFTSYADDLVDGDDNESSDVFLYDLSTKRTQLISRNSEGNVGDDMSFSPSISGDGQIVAFATLATNLGERKTTAGEIILFRDGRCSAISFKP